MSQSFERRVPLPINTRLVVAIVVALGIWVAFAGGGLVDKLAVEAMLGGLIALFTSLHLIATDTDIGWRVGPFGWCVDRNKAKAITTTSRGIKVWGERQFSLHHAGSAFGPAAEPLSDFLRLPLAVPVDRLGRPQVVLAARPVRRAQLWRRVQLLVVPWLALAVPGIVVIALTRAPFSAHNADFLFGRGVLRTLLLGLPTAIVLVRDRSFTSALIGTACLNAGYCLLWGVNASDPPGPLLIQLTAAVPPACLVAERARWFGWCSEAR